MPEDANVVEVRRVIAHAEADRLLPLEHAA
jgi:hypothetical protein